MLTPYVKAKRVTTLRDKRRAAVKARLAKEARRARAAARRGAVCK